MGVGSISYSIFFAALALCSHAPRSISGAPSPSPSADGVCVQARYKPTDGGREKEQTDERLKVSVNANGKIFTYVDEIVVPSDFTVAEEIEKRQINGTIEQKIKLVDKAVQKGASYKTALLTCFPRLEFTARAIAERVFVPVEDAKVICRNGGYHVTKEKTGKMLDEQKLYGGLYYSIKYFGGERVVKAYTLDVEPDVRAAELSQKISLRASYTTDYSTSSRARAHNVTTAVKKLDGATLKNGERLSFNECVGDRTTKNGFQTAKIIVDGKYVDGVGGGACQASTAVYNAALAAGLTASANAHSICPSYCPPGLDAMISSASDLVISNDTGDDVYFSVKAGGGKATVNIYGAPREYDIVTESVVSKVIACGDEEYMDTERKYFDADAVRGDRLLLSSGKDGCVCDTYLKYFKDGKFVKRVKIRSNTYKPSPRITVVAP